MGKLKKEGYEREEKNQRVLSHLLAEDEKILWRGKISTGVERNFDLMMKVIIIFMFVSITLGFVSGGILMAQGDFRGLFLLSAGIGTGILPLAIFGIDVLDIGGAKDEDYFITSKKIIHLDHYFVEPNTTIIKLDNIDRVAFKFRFGRVVRHFVIRGNEKTKAIQHIEFYSEFYADHPEECVFWVEEDGRIPSEEHLKGNNLLEFKYLDDWRTVASVLQTLIPRKIEKPNASLHSY